MLLSAYQRNYQAHVLRSDLRAGLRNATELLVQEIAQAGVIGGLPNTLTGTVAASPTPLPVNVASTTGLFVGEKLQIDVGSASEVVAITAIGSGTITGVFTRSHAANAPITALGVLPQGVLSTSTGTQLRIVGDVNADGSVVYVKYDCDVSAGALTRSSTPITASASNPGTVLLDNLVANPDGTPCFTYTSTTAGGYTFVTAVGVTLTARTVQIDPQSGTFFTETKSFLHVGPRNVLIGLTLANAGITALLQPIPPGVPLP